MSPAPHCHTGALAVLFLASSLSRRRTGWLWRPQMVILKGNEKDGNDGWGPKLKGRERYKRVLLNGFCGPFYRAYKPTSSYAPYGLLFGPPGTGKTTAADALAHKLAALCDKDALRLAVTASDLKGRWKGGVEKQIAAMVTACTIVTKLKHCPVLLFMDELDGWMNSDDTDLRGAMSVLKATLGDLPLTYGECEFDPESGTVVPLCLLGTSNFPMRLEPAIRSRLPQSVFVPLPNATDRCVARSRCARWLCGCVVVWANQLPPPYLPAARSSPPP